MEATATQLDAAALASLEAAKVADARGSACPGPLLEAKKSIGGVPVGQVLEILTTDPQTKSDIGAWCAKVGHAFLGTASAAGYERVFVRRAR
jgi:tRNA 2-thiouridine synthesizing protein A